MLRVDDAAGLSMAGALCTHDLCSCVFRLFCLFVNVRTVGSSYYVRMTLIFPPRVVPVVGWAVPVCICLCAFFLFVCPLARLLFLCSRLFYWYLCARRERGRERCPRLRCCRRCCCCSWWRWCWCWCWCCLFLSFSKVVVVVMCWCWCWCWCCLFLSFSTLVGLASYPTALLN